MSADVINLRQARKKKARAEKEKTAADNRLLFGRSKAEKDLTKATTDLQESRLEAHRRDKTTPPALDRIAEAPDTAAPDAENGTSQDASEGKQD